MLITVYKDGVEMEANSNPDGILLLAKSGWVVKAEVDPEPEAAPKPAPKSKK
jgi:hypothetical protein